MINAVLLNAFKDLSKQKFDSSSIQSLKEEIDLRHPQLVE